MDRTPCSSRSLVLARVAGLLAIVVGAAWTGIAWSGVVSTADDVKDEGPLSGRSLDGWGRLGSPLRDSDDFHQLTFYTKDSKGRTKSEKILVQIPEEREVHLDMAVRVEDIESGKPAYVLARKVERDVPRRRGGGIGGNRGGKDYQMQAARVVLVGDELAVNEKYTDPKDEAYRWYKGTVTQTTGGLAVQYDGHEYRVTMDTRAPILRRIKCDRKLLKSGQYVHVAGTKTAPPPEAEESASTRDLKAFAIQRVVILDRRYLTTAYAAILK